MSQTNQVREQERRSEECCGNPESPLREATEACEEAAASINRSFWTLVEKLDANGTLSRCGFSEQGGAGDEPECASSLHRLRKLNRYLSSIDLHLVELIRRVNP